MICLRKLGKRFLTAGLVITMILSVVTVNLSMVSALSERNVKPTETIENPTPINIAETDDESYVVENMSYDSIEVTISHLLDGVKIYSDDNTEINSRGKINNYKKAANYDIVNAIVTTAGKTQTLTGEALRHLEADDDIIIVVNYSKKTSTQTGNTVFYDYDVKPRVVINGSDRESSTGRYWGAYYSINYIDNYSNKSNNAIRFAMGTTNMNYTINTYNHVYNGKKINAYDRGTGANSIKNGIIKGLSEDYNEVLFNVDNPGVFTNTPTKGKTIYNDYTLQFTKSGDNYKFDGVKHPSGKFTKSGANFFPLNEHVNETYVDQANTDGNNCFFGMRYDVEFTLGDYIGDLNYSFTGDDDLWVLLDGEVVLDIGGIHDAISKNINLWNALEQKGIVKGNLTEKQKNEPHRLTILYMERGAYASNCQMNFTIPNAYLVDVSDAPKTDLTIEKVSSESSTTLLPGANFVLTSDDNPNDIRNLVTDEKGQLHLTNLTKGTYTLTETSAPDGYQINEKTYKIIVEEVGGEAVSKLYQQNGTLIGDNKITNVPIKITSENIQTNKTASLIDWDERLYQVDLYAAHNILPVEKQLNLALMLDFSGSMPWFVTKPTGGNISYSQLNTKANREAYTLSTGGSKGVSAWSGYKYYVLRDGEGSSKEYKPVAYLSSKEAGNNYSAGWYSIASGSNGEKGRQTVVSPTERIYVRGANDQTKLEALQTAITNFIENLKIVSPKSKVAIIPYAGQIITGVANTNQFTNIDNINIKDIFSKITLLGGTYQNLALDQAYSLLNKSNYDKANTYGILFSDGDVSGGNGQLVNTAADNLKKKVNLLFTAGIFGDTKSSGTENMKNWASNDPVDASKKLVYIRNTSTDLIDAFSEIFGYITVQLNNVTVVDYIDNRFDITDENGNKLDIKEGKEIDFAGGKVGKDERGVYIKWTKVNLSYAQDLKYGWHRTIYVKAKDDYIGGNNVKTNIDSISEVKTEDGKAKEFITPTVNVKIALEVGNNSDVLFKGEVYGNENIEKLIDKMFDLSNYNPNYKGVDLTNCTFTWYKDETLMEPVDLKELTEDGKYYLKVVYNVKEANAQSNNNTTKDGIVYNNGTGVQAINKDDETKNYGVLAINFVAGQLKIEKTIDNQYVTKNTASKINSNQTFVFKIQQYQVNSDGSKGSLVKTFYQTISFNANESEVTKTAVISELEKGYYTISEESSWSTKYDLKSIKDNYENNDVSGTDILIGELTNIDSNGIKTMYGLDKSCNNNYESMAKGEAAKVSFKNEVNNWSKWYSDTGLAKNIFNQ